MSLKSVYIHGDEFVRVGRAFAVLGFTVPRHDAGINGAYAMNIAAQYPFNLSEQQAQ